MRGSWQVRLYADPKGSSIAETSVLVEDFQPERLAFELETDAKAIGTTTPAIIDLTARYLYGATAPGLSIDGDIDIRPAENAAPASTATTSASPRSRSNRPRADRPRRRDRRGGQGDARGRPAATAGHDAAARGADHRPHRRHQRPRRRTPADAAGDAGFADDRHQAAVRRRRGRGRRAPPISTSSSPRRTASASAAPGLDLAARADHLRLPVVPLRRELELRDHHQRRARRDRRDRDQGRRPGHGLGQCRLGPLPAHRRARRRRARGVELRVLRRLVRLLGGVGNPRRARRSPSTSRPIASATRRSSASTRASPASR